MIADVSIRYEKVSQKQPMKKFFIETHGCQMNLADSDIVRSVLLNAGYEMCEILEEADLILTNTCAIRENAEAKIWQRLKYFQSLRKKARMAGKGKSGYPIVGVLGCMAERLKTKLLEDEGVDFIAGPDAYRTLPDLLNTVSTDQKAANVVLSLDETYADIPPVRLAEGNTHAFVTITRGCNNYCSFCVVPFTRGKERSRLMSSVLSEVCELRDRGIKEVVLLGQNVNSYHDLSTSPDVHYSNSYAPAPGFTSKKSSIPVHLRRDHRSDESITLSVSPPETTEDPVVVHPSSYDGAAGGAMTALVNAWNSGSISSSPSSFEPGGARFGDLLLEISRIDPEMRIRFQSPHPKDFPDDVLALIASTPNICNSLHMPVQHGSTSVLERMRRGYSREAYLGLIERARSIIGGSDGEAGLGLSTDIIAGFCQETEEEHVDSVSLLRTVGFDQAFTYAYSKREQTFAGLFLPDDVPEDVKGRRLQELVDTFQSAASRRNAMIETGRLHLVLVEGLGKGSTPEAAVWTGRTDTNKRVVFGDWPDRKKGSISKGSYVVVRITGARGHTLRGNPEFLCSISEWSSKKLSFPSSSSLSTNTNM